jgi:hypothetical protein
MTAGAGRPDDRRVAGSSFFPNSESRPRRNHELPKSGIPKRKKTATNTRLSCKIEYLLASNQHEQSIAFDFFTDDSNITLDSCDLFGCGTMGLEFVDCERIEVVNVTIRDCTYGILNAKNVSELIFRDCKFHNNREFDLCTISGASSHIMFTDCTFTKNVSRGAMFYFDELDEKATTSYVRNCQFYENQYVELTNNSELFSEYDNQFRNNRIGGNSWRSGRG